ncbi:MAG: hypothetical protein U0559_18875 [Anaerolineae bacterium]
MELEQASHDCLIVVTPRRLALFAAIFKVACIAFLYMCLFAVLSGSQYLDGATITRVLAMAQTNFWAVVILLVPLVFTIPLFGDLRLIVEGRKLTFNKTQNTVLLNRHPLAALSDIAQMRIKSERVRGGVRYHLLLEFYSRHAFELDESTDMVKLHYSAQSIVEFLKIPFEEPEE